MNPPFQRFGGGTAALGPDKAGALQAHANVADGPANSRNLDIMRAGEFSKIGGSSPMDLAARMVNCRGAGGASLRGFGVWRLCPFTQPRCGLITVEFRTCWCSAIKGGKDTNACEPAPLILK